MTAKTRPTSFLLLSFVAFFASGASSLVAEVTWNRMLIVVVGNSMSATAMILVVFMGGLGAGSYVAGQVLAGRRRSLLPYLVLELAIGGYILASPAILALLSQAFSALSEHVSHQLALTAVRMVVSLTALLVPAFLMGATFPAMVGGTAEGAPSAQTARTGFLYGVNTLGASLGAFVAGYHLLLEFGVQTTLACAFGLNLTAAGCALLAHRLRPPSREPAPAPQATAGPAAWSGRGRFLGVATFGIGFVALAYEVVLTRLSILYLGNVASVFALVLTGFLLGTALSALLGTWGYGILRRRTRSGQGLFGGLLLLAGVAVVGAPYLILAAGGVAFDVLELSPLQALAVIIGPTLLIGALLPIAIRLLEPAEPQGATRAAADFYALNTLGGLIGAGLVNQFLVPAVGIQGVILLLAAICALLGVTSLWPGGRPLWRLGRAAATIAAVAVVAFALPGLTRLYAIKLARTTRARSVDVRLVREGRAANVTVLDQADPTYGTYRDMYLNGVEEASTRYWHTQLFKLLGTLPILAHESSGPKDVLVIAFGAGITAGSVLSSDEVASLDVVDLNPDVEGINDLFKAVNGDVFHRPAFHFHVDDGRNFLVTSGKKYSAIISDSTHPRAYDSWILYTQEFYRSVKARLSPGGVFAQWVPVDPSMRGELFRIHLNTFRSVFPNPTLWYVYGSDQAFLLSTPHPLRIDAVGWQRKLDRLPGWFHARDYQLDSVAHLAGFFWLDEPALLRMIGPETRIDTDDRHYFEKQSALVPVPEAQRLPQFQASVLPYLEDAHDGLRLVAHREQVIAQLVARYGFFHSVPDLVASYCFMPQNGDVRWFMAREFSSQIPDGLCSAPTAPGN